MKQMLLVAAAISLISAGSALAGPTYTFSTSVGSQPSDVGVITLTQINTTTVDVLIDLSDTSLPLPQYGFVNTGGQHTPFAFTIQGTESGVTANFLQPSGGAFSFGLLTLDLGGGGNTPYGTYGVAIDSSAGNGSGDAYYGDLEFQLTRTSGLSTDDFISNGTAYFTADLTNGSSTTGAQAWDTRDPGTPTPEPASLAILGAGLAAFGWARSVRRKN